MKLSERFDSFTPIEIKRAIEMREREIIKTESEIRALQKLAKSKTAALPDGNTASLRVGTNKRQVAHG